VNRTSSYRRLAATAARAAAVLALVGLAGCTKIAAVKSPLTYVAQQLPQRVWVIRAHNDSVLELFQPRTQEDTLIGFVGGTYTEIPIHDVKQVRAQQPARVRTALLSAGISGAVIVEYARLTGGGGNGAAILQGTDTCFCDFDDICC